MLLFCFCKGGYPLHHVCNFNSSVEVLKMIYEAYPEAMHIAQAGILEDIRCSIIQQSYLSTRIVGDSYYI